MQIFFTMTAHLTKPVLTVLFKPIMVPLSMLPRLHKSRRRRLLIGHFSAKYEDLSPLLEEARDLP